MSLTKIAFDYITFLEHAEVDKIVSLFSDKGKVNCIPIKDFLLTVSE